MTPQEPATIFDLFLRFNRRLVRVLGSLRLGLSVNESHVLAEIAREGEVLAKDISGTLNIEKSTLSRTIDSLYRRGLIVHARKTADRRAKELNLSPRGAAALAADVGQRNHSIQICLMPLAPAQREVLARVFRCVADNLGVPSVAEIPDEDPVEREIRRLTRALGVLSGDFAGTGVPVDRCQVLGLLLAAGGKLPFAELKQELRFELSALSRLVTALSSQGLLVKEPDPKDKRTIFVMLTPQGSALTQRMAEQGDRHLRLQLRGLPPKTEEEFVRVLETLYRSGSPTLPQGQLKVLRLQSRADLRRARRFVVEQLVLRNDHHELPGLLLSEDSLVMAAMQEQRFAAVAALEPPATLSHVVFNADGAHAVPQLLVALWKAAGTRNVLQQIRAAPAAAAALKKVFPGKVKSGAGLTITAAMVARLDAQLDLPG